jgi:peptidoglycan L-alanyl-D-glutamate endopeptidase CwlK
MSRRISALNPTIRVKYIEFDLHMKAAGISYIVTCTDRTILEQMALYVQGRLSIQDVNKFRKAAGMYLLPSDHPNRKVTWTLQSKHVTNGIDNDPSNDFSKAFDICIVKDGKAQWELKVDVNENEIPDYEEAGRIWESLGGTWGGNFRTTKDYPHFEV